MMMIIPRIAIVTGASYQEEIVQGLFILMMASGWEMNK
jgi:hypothetical protein